MAGTFCGHSDPNVNARGKEQIRELNARLAHEAIDEVYSSDLRRAVSTAERIAKAFAAPVILKPRLRELHFGDWEGLTWAEIERLDPAYAKKWIEQFPNLPAPGGESLVHFQTRVIDEIRHLHAREENKKIAVVSHRGVMRVVLRAFHGRSEQEAFDLTNSYCCSIACNGADENLQTTPFTGD